MLLKEETLILELRANVEGQKESQVWYLDKTASNHMTVQHGKFMESDESMSGQVKFGDGCTVSIKRKEIVSFRLKNGEYKHITDIFL